MAEKNRILVIDDEKRMCDSIKVLLSNIGYEVDTAENGRSGIEKLKNHTFGLVITDLMMPELDGFAVMKYIKENCPNTLVIVITGYASVESAVRAIRSGAYDYILKPFDFEIIKISVERAWDKLKLERELEKTRKLAQVAERAIALNNELNNPLSITSGFAQLLQIRLEESGDNTTKRQVNSIIKASESMHQMNLQFRRFARSLLNDNSGQDFEML
ncbi:MAG: response regulator [Candidatus Abyssobacteria bacterium SURF_5]|uniref:histidine kinase n=1 Tax=Abyssobacteria bacterium (strain SURF_5) TaxID=2093360 RepID=A0A3A4NYB4_ABYX5|nr:MAG: response regulator [Candidatus Abyssubacteria bacterium SURF_5]